jgi:hypothetical protein
MAHINRRINDAVFVYNKKMRPVFGVYRKDDLAGVQTTLYFRDLKAHRYLPWQA